MKTSKQEIIINFKPQDLYKIVIDIEKYPEFIPWCNRIEIKSKTQNEIVADMIVKYKFFLPKIFTSHVFFDSKKLIIKTKYVKGPLKHLNTEWSFQEIKKKKTKVVFKVNFEFNNLFFQKSAELFFGLIESQMIESFKQRAKEILD